MKTSLLVFIITAFIFHIDFRGVAAQSPIITSTVSQSMNSDVGPTPSLPSSAAATSTVSTPSSSTVSPSSMSMSSSGIPTAIPTTISVGISSSLPPATTSTIAPTSSAPVTPASSSVPTTAFSSTTTSTTSAAATTPAKNASFDAGSFIGGMLLSAGIIFIFFLGYKYYRNRKERSYNHL